MQLAREGAPQDEVRCEGLRGPDRENLAWQALSAFRAATGWAAPALRLTIDKAIPIAAGLGGGSADAAAALRLACHVSGLGDERLLRELGAELGADVPAQLRPGSWLATGAGEELRELAGLRALARAARAAGRRRVVHGGRLRAGRQAGPGAKRGRAGRIAAARWRRRGRRRARICVRALLADGELLHNDLQQAAVALCPQIAQALAQAGAAGADAVLVSGSGPTVVGLFGRGRWRRWGCAGVGGCAVSRAPRRGAAGGTPAGGDLRCGAGRPVGLVAGGARRLAGPGRRQRLKAQSAARSR